MDASLDTILPVAINSIILLFFSAVFSGAETAFTNLSPARVEIIRKDGKFASRLIYKLHQRLDMLISLSLILSNGVNIFLATYLTIFFTGIFGIELGGLLSATLGTVLVIIFGEIIPKKIAIMFTVTFTRATAHLLEICRFLIYPLLYPVLLINRSLDKIKDHDIEKSRQLMQDEIQATLGIGHSHGALEQKEFKMMTQLLLLNDKVASQIMTHQSDIVAIRSDSSLRSLVQLADEHKVSRIPVYTESKNNIEYIVHTPQLSAYLLDPTNLDRPVSDFCTTKALKVPESKIIDDLFFEFQEKRTHMAIVLNEYGHTSGLITLEDIIEEIFGNIEDESDATEEEIRMLDDTTCVVQGGVTIEEVEDSLKTTLPEKYPKHKTISWLVLDLLHRFPKEGEIIRVPNSHVQLKVIGMDKEYIDSVEIRNDKVKP
jgi:putative hemolysin